jgi:hypothetical protein
MAAACYHADVYVAWGIRNAYMPACLIFLLYNSRLAFTQ